MVSSGALKSHLIVKFWKQGRLLVSWGWELVSEVTDHTFHLNLIHGGKGTWKEEGSVHEVLGPQADGQCDDGCPDPKTGSTAWERRMQAIAEEAERLFSHETLWDAEHSQASVTQVTKVTLIRGQGHSLWFFMPHSSDPIPWQGTFRLSWKITLWHLVSRWVLAAVEEPGTDTWICKQGTWTQCRSRRRTARLLSHHKCGGRWKSHLSNLKILWNEQESECVEYKSHCEFTCSQKLMKSRACLISLHSSLLMIW